MDISVCCWRSCPVLWWCLVGRGHPWTKLAFLISSLSRPLQKRWLIPPSDVSVANEPAQKAGSFGWTMRAVSRPFDSQVVVFLILSEKYLGAAALATGVSACCSTNHVRIDKAHTTKQGGAEIAALRLWQEEEWEMCWRRERSEDREECGAKMSENRKRSRIWMHFDSCVKSCPILISMLRFL